VHQLLSCAPAIVSVHQLLSSCAKAQDLKNKHEFNEIIIWDLVSLIRNHYDDSRDLRLLEEGESETDDATPPSPSRVEAATAILHTTGAAVNSAVHSASAVLVKLWAEQGVAGNSANNTKVDYDQLPSKFPDTEDHDEDHGIEDSDTVPYNRFWPIKKSG